MPEAQLLLHTLIWGKNDSQPEHDEEAARELATEIGEEIARTGGYTCAQAKTEQECAERWHDAALKDAQNIRVRIVAAYDDCTQEILSQPWLRDEPLEVQLDARLNCVSAKGFERQIAVIRRSAWPAVS